jgi:signal transduction histidine kinase
MKDETTHLIFLGFINKETERNFIKEYDGDNRIFFRIGIYLSCFAWTIWYSGVYFSHYEVFQKALIILVSVLLLPFIIVVAFSFYKKLSTFTHGITAFCNFAAACICIYVAVYLTRDITLLCAGVVCINFFCYFILRIRFKISFIVTLSYAFIAQYCVLTSGNFTNDQVFTSSSGIWLGFFIATVAGYFFERTNRKIFVQNGLIKEQQEELLNEKNKLKLSLEHLKSTQTQLIQSEKMASLGELTAGIAHEIQNPLNFVNNFSEVNKELISEMKSELVAGNREEAIEIANDLEQNLEKINHHGKRADAIVKGMLQHSRTSTGKKEPTDINKLTDEYLRLSYFGLRAKDQYFNANMQTNFDESIGKVDIIPQDIGRVMLNLFNNAFYAVAEKKKQLREGYEPTVSVITKKLNDKIEIRVNDNGNGIPQKVLDKIFQPFFTTKPTGQGTGLGLSLSYDIIKAHGGEIKVQTKEGEGTTFILAMPAN